ncbi:MAG: DNA repair protein RecN [Flavobacteriales bacterium]|nr:DNA repair protein RecN [Flavobacteriales bacterium]
MLQYLSINNYALIDTIEIDFCKGFSVITGETGSGKSIILGALQLILGERADTKVIYDKNRKCVIEASFVINSYNLSSFFSKHDIDFDTHQTIIRREIHSNGKSRAFINDCPVKLDLLKAFSSKVIDIHSQHQSLLINKSNYQIQLIDTLASIKVKDHNTQIKVFQSNLYELNTIKEQLDKILNGGVDSKNELDYLLFLNSELDEANIRNGEKEELETALKVYENSENITNTLKKVIYILDQQQVPVSSQFHEILVDLQKISNLDLNYDDIRSRMQSISIELSDFSKECDLLLSKIEHNNFDIEEATQRLNLIYQLEQKHRVYNYQSLTGKHIEIKEKVEQLSSIDLHISNLESEISILNDNLNKTASIISSNRLLVCPEIEDFVINTVKQLGINNGRFKVAVEQDEHLNSHGKDQVKFLFSANKGVPLQEMSKVASGGEISRLMLAIKALLAKHLKLPSLILDEIDSGVSGEIAGKISKILLEISKEIQLIVITHLPQVAAKANYHYKVEKHDDLKKNTTIINKLNDNERLDELAKMLSGETISLAAIENAKALISNH